MDPLVDSVHTSIWTPYLGKRANCTTPLPDTQICILDITKPPHAFGFYETFHHSVITVTSSLVMLETWSDGTKFGYI